MNPKKLFHTIFTTYTRFERTLTNSIKRARFITCVYKLIVL
jgi:hypothetical protein